MALLALGLPCALVACQRGSGRDPGTPPGPAPTTASAPSPDPVGAAVERIIRLAATEDDPQSLMTALVALGEPAIPYLAQVIAHPEEKVRMLVVEALGEMALEGGVDPLLAALEDSSSEVRLGAVEALGKIRSRRAVGPLLTQLDRDDDAQVRYECLTSLGLIGDPGASPRLVAETRNADPYMRMWAMDALCTMRDPQAPSLVLSLLEDPNVYVQRRVIRSCPQAAQSDAARQVLLEVTLGEGDFEASVVARQLLVEQLKGTGPDAGVSQEARTHVRQEATRALRSGSPTRAVRAAFLLANLGEKEGFATLLASLEDPDPLIRHHAAHLLGEVKDEHAVAPLVAALRDASPIVRMSAVGALQHYAQGGNAKAQEALASFTRDAASDRAP